MTIDSLTRRAMLRGGGRSNPDKTELHISSLIVQAMPARLAAVKDAIVRHGGEVAAQDDRGKLIAVIESADSALVAEFANTLSLVPGVVSANLVFHAVDDGAGGDSDLQSEENL